MISCLLLCACGNNKSNENTTAAAPEEAATASMTLDEMIANADSLTDQLVTVEAVCTHTCRHGARKIFLQGSDNTQTIRCEFADHRPFSKDCIHSVVSVTGYLRETRMDEAYLQNWKNEYEMALANNQVEEEEAGSSAGCETESAARREKGATIDEKIENYRQLIAQRKAAEGKEYLSFYHLEATDYAIVTAE